MSLYKVVTVSAVAFAFGLLGPHQAFAHCDGLDGPVVRAAQRALDTGQLAHVLIWVRSDDETEIRSAFESTIAVRALSPESKELADRFFFETVVRLHRAGEGESYTGLKPAGRDLGPAIPAADKALDQGALEPVIKLLSKAMEEGLRRRFAKTAARSFAPGDIDRGREYVNAYVQFIHYVERLYEATTTSDHGHLSETHGTETLR